MLTDGNALANYNYCDACSLDPIGLTPEVRTWLYAQACTRVAKRHSLSLLSVAPVSSQRRRKNHVVQISSVCWLSLGAAGSWHPFRFSNASDQRGRPQPFTHNAAAAHLARQMKPLSSCAHCFSFTTTILQTSKNYAYAPRKHARRLSVFAHPAACFASIRNSHSITIVVLKGRRGPYSTVLSRKDRPIKLGFRV